MQCIYNQYTSIGYISLELRGCSILKVTFSEIIVNFCSFTIRAYRKYYVPFVLNARWTLGILFLFYPPFKNV